MSQRFFVESPLSVGQSIVVVGPEAHHMIHVMRLDTGDQIILFDGSGAEFPSRITRIGKREVRAEVLSHRLVDRESPLALQLAVALPRGDRQTWLVEKAVELGVQSLLPLITDRGVAVPNERTILRLRRTVVESSKQCGRNRLMQIDPPCRLPDYLMLEADSRTQRLLAHPVPHADDAAAAMPDGSSRAEFDRFRVAIGPEGGFTHDEVKLARDHGWRTISCGPRILRVETAAIAISARILL